MLLLSLRLSTRPRLAAGLAAIMLLYSPACARVGLQLTADATTQDDGWLDLSTGADAASDAGDAAPANLWRSLGASTSGFGLTGRDTRASTLRLAVGPTGTLYHAWADEHSGTWQVYLRRWGGSAWQELAGSGSAGGVSNTADTSRLGNVVVDGDDRPWLCFFDRGEKRHIYLRHYTGKQWSELGGSATAGGVSGHGNVWWPQMALVPAGPVVAWERYNVLPEGGAIHLKRAQGGTWIEVGGSATGAGVSVGSTSSQQVTLRSQGRRVHVLWHTSPPKNSALKAGLRYRLFDGTWLAPEAPGSGPAAPARASGTLAVTRLGIPIAAWRETANGGTTIRAARRETTGWRDLGNLSGALKQVDHPSIAITASGTVYVFFEARDELGMNIHVRRLVGESWVTPPGDALPHGVSASSRASTYPRAVAGGGRLYVAWEEALGGQATAAYLRYLVAP